MAIIERAENEGPLMRKLEETLLKNHGSPTRVYLEESYTIPKGAYELLTLKLRVESCQSTCVKLFEVKTTEATPFFNFTPLHHRPSFLKYWWYR